MSTTRRPRRRRSPKGARTSARVRPGAAAISDAPRTVAPQVRQAVIREAERLLVPLADVLAHDDGMRVDELPLADVVLVGVSRVSKSVTCFYLASRGIRAANVPIVPDQPLPVELASIDPR